MLCDVRLPDMGAPEFLEEVRRRRPDMADRIVFATGDVVGERTRIFLDAIPNPALYKPFRIEDLQQAIAGVLEGS